MFAWRKITPDGFERTFALNHVAPFVLTHGLSERLFAAAPARVINVSGALHQLATLHLEDLRLEHRYDAFYAYAHVPWIKPGQRNNRSDAGHKKKGQRKQNPVAELRNFKAVREGGEHSCFG